MEDFDLAFTWEGLARAFALAGDLDQAREYYDLAVDPGKKIGDAEDRKIFMNDFQGGNWHKFSPKLVPIFPIG